MFQKKAKDSQELPKFCRFCERASIIRDECNILCSKYGIVNADYCCKSFSYDPLKRVPKPLPSLPRLSEEDLLI